MGASLFLLILLNRCSNKMPIIDRVKSRFETDVDDVELQLMIDEVNQDIGNRYGPHANPGNPVTVRMAGDSESIVLDRQIDVSYPVAVTEYITYWGWGETSIVLNALDYRIWAPGYRVERLLTGPNTPWYYRKWAQQVEFTFTPINDGNSREEVMIKVVILDLQYKGLFPGIRSSVVGDVILSEADYQAEREKLIGSLAPRAGLFLV